MLKTALALTGACLVSLSAFADGICDEKEKELLRQNNYNECAISAICREHQDFEVSIVHLKQELHTDAIRQFLVNNGCHDVVVVKIGYGYGSSDGSSGEGYHIISKNCRVTDDRGHCPFNMAAKEIGKPDGLGDSHMNFRQRKLCVRKEASRETSSTKEKPAIKNGKRP